MAYIESNVLKVNEEDRDLRVILHTKVQPFKKCAEQEDINQQGQRYYVAQITGETTHIDVESIPETRQRTAGEIAKKS